MATVTYISGPMSGYPQHNEPAFRLVAKELEERGELTVVPHDIEPGAHEGDCPPGPPVITTGGHMISCYLRSDVHVMLECDRVYVMNGWEASPGARLEVQVAAACGIPLEFER